MARAKTTPKRQPLVIRSLTLTHDADETLQRLSQNASDCLGVDSERIGHYPGAVAACSAAKLSLDDYPAFPLHREGNKQRGRVGQKEMS